jgi:LAO/AO transport system kinase
MEPSSPSESANSIRTSGTSSEFERAAAGDRGALARLLTKVERGVLPAGPPASAGDEPFVVGITGAPGVGKSSLVSAVVADWRKRGQRVALLLVDPSSPISGGAVLGDRVRMAEIATDDGVFCRSVATRGHLGGLTATTRDIVATFGRSGWPLVIIETVGVGQVEVDIMGLADLTVVVLAPGAGDSVQAAKAGIMEIGDLYVLNKADVPGIGQLRRDVQSALTHAASAPEDRASGGPHRFEQRIFETSAARGSGISELVDRLAESYAARVRYAGSAGRRAVSAADTARAALAAALERRLREEIGRLQKEDRFAAAVDRITSGGSDAESEAEALFGTMCELPPNGTLEVPAGPSPGGATGL